MLNKNFNYFFLQMVKWLILRCVRLLDKIVLSTKKERINSYKVYNRLFNKEIIYNSVKYEDYVK